MAVRLNVIMVHGAPQTATAQRVAQSVVGELIGLAGIDLTLIDRLKEIQPTSTDFLTLDSITSDVAVLDWETQDAIVHSLNTVGFVGSRSRHAHDVQAENVTESRRIYAFNLGEFNDGPSVIAALRALWANRQVKTVSLGSLLPAPGNQRAKPGSATPGTAADSPTRPHGHDSTGPSKAPEPRQPTSQLGESEPDPQANPKKVLDLDALVDQLDLLDQ